jgi:hypothetical protein
VNMTLPFGQHRGEALDSVPADYLEWLLKTVKLSSGMRALVAGELERRGFTPPPASPPPTPPRCSKCPGEDFSCTWAVDAIGRRHIRATCAACGRHLCYLPQVLAGPPPAGVAAAGLEGRTS